MTRCPKTGLTGKAAGPRAESLFFEAGETQVIPTLNDSEDENLVPNVRTRQSSNRTAYTPVKEEKNSNIDESKNTQSAEDLKKAKKKKMTIIAISLVLIIIAGGFLGFFINRIVNNDEDDEIEIPNLVGKDFEEAQKECQEKGLELRQRSSDYNTDYEEGQIITQDPQAGTKTKEKIVYADVSKGTRMVKVTNIEGKDIKVAKYELENTLGFVVEQENVISDTVAAGIVISQEYKDVERPYGSVIKVQVSSGDGKAQVVVQNVVGKSEEEARSILEGLKLNVEVQYDVDNEKLNGTVLAQSYPTNSVLKEGDLITITVNRREINKTITVTGIPAGTKREDIEVRVSIDGGALNTTTFNYSENDNQLTFTINGYENVKYEVSVDGNLIKSGEENF